MRQIIRWLFVFLLTAPVMAFAWGGEGHRIVCAIAWEELKAPVRFKVEDILHIRSQEQFAETCNYADEYREGHRETASWHYVNVPEGATEVNVDRDCRSKKSCVVEQIGEDLKTLRSKASKEDKAFALKFLAHFVGDIHQPLHVSYAADSGGNAIKGRFFGKSTDLHAVWDAGIIENAHKPWLTIAHDLRRKVTPSKRHVWIGSIPLLWANESLAITLDPATQYVGVHHFDLGADYEKPELPIVYDRLSGAGVRLGNLLNGALQ